MLNPKFTKLHKVGTSEFQQKIIWSSPTSPPCFREAIMAVGLTSTSLAETRRKKKTAGAALKSKIAAKKENLQKQKQKKSKTADKVEAMEVE